MSTRIHPKCMNYNWKQPNHKYGKNLISSLSNRAHECQKRNFPVLLCRIVIPTSKEKLSGFVNFLWSSYKSGILPRFKYRDFNKSIWYAHCKCLQWFTDLGTFIIYSLLWIFFFQISLQFLQGFQATSNLRKFHRHVMGYPVQHRDFLYFL